MKKLDAIIIAKASAKEIAALVLAVQERRETRPAREMPEDERESLIRQYELRLEKLKAGASPGNVIF